MSKVTKKLLIINIVSIILIIAAFIGIHFYVIYINNYGFDYHMGEKEINCSLSVKESKSWSEDAHGYKYGIQYDATMKNLSNVNLRDWVATIKVPKDCKIDSYWSGEFSLDDNGLITITPVIYNKTIEIGGEREIGMVLYSNTKNNIEDFQIHFYKLIDDKDVSVFWIVVLLTVILLITDIVILVSEIRVKAIKKQKQEYVNIVDQSFLTFANMIDAKDPYTRGHSQRVAIYSREIAKRMGLSDEEQQHIFYVALLHDIGKIGTPDSILKKEGKLTDEEREVIQQHVKVGGDILKDFNAINGIEDGARYHHERYDGNGYVENLKGDEIPLIGRIICIADAFDAMTSNRCYRPSLSINWVVEELERCSGTQFDPNIVPYMLEMIKEGKAPVDIESQPIQFHI